MAYIWEDYSVDKQFNIGERICPYIEVIDNRLNYVDVNPMIRFVEIADIIKNELFQKLFDNPAIIENIIFHYLAQLDRTKGFSYYQRIIEGLRIEIEDGYWGGSVKKLWERLKRTDQDIILSVLTLRLLSDNQTYFMEVVGKLFPEASLCYEEATEIYYLYIRSKRNEYNLTLMNIVKELFWSIDKKLIIVWEKHYGIIGNSDTMSIGQIQVM